MRVKKQLHIRQLIKHFFSHLLQTLLVYILRTEQTYVKGRHHAIGCEVVYEYASIIISFWDNKSGVKFLRSSMINSQEKPQIRKSLHMHSQRSMATMAKLWFEITTKVFLFLNGDCSGIIARNSSILQLLLKVPHLERNILGTSFKNTKSYW